MFDLVGSGLSDVSAYDPEKYSTLDGYADDLIEIIEEYSPEPIIFVGHSVSSIIGLLATIKKPHHFLHNIMVGPSPSYINDGDYYGGFDKSDIDELIRTLEDNYLGWASNTAPAIMGSPEKPELGEELTNSFCKTDPEIAKHFAKVTFLSDHRQDLPRSKISTLIIQCDDDFIAPLAVGTYMQKVMPNAQLQVIENTGHCPHLSSPEASGAAIKTFLQENA